MPPHLFSPSQITTFLNECQRKWGWGTLFKLRYESNASAALGTDVHSQLERYLSGGALDYTKPSGYIAAAGLHHLPPPKYPGMVLEQKFVFQSPETKFWYHGLRDVFLPSWVEEFPDGAPVVLDHKSTSGLKWAKTVRELEYDPQSVIYARAANAPLVHNRWVYYQTKGAKKSLPVDRPMLREDVARQFSTLELTTTKMHAIVQSREGLSPNQLEELVLSLPINVDACEMYGGCPYRHKCNLGPELKLAAIWATDLKPNNPLKMLEESQTTNMTMSLIERLAATPAGQTEPSARPAVGINPPPLPVSTIERVAATPDIPGFVTPAAGTPAAPKAKKPTKAEKEAAKRAEAETLPPPAPEAPKGLETVLPCGSGPEIEVVDETNPNSYTLYIDCLPDSQAQDVAFVYDISKKAVCDKFKVSDYRAIEYGAGPGYLAVAVQDCINSGLLKGDVFVSTQCQETHACLAVLVRSARKTVRGTR